MAFNPTDRKYTFCCCIPSLVGATVLSTLETILVGAKLYQALNLYLETMDNPSLITVLATILFAVLWGWYVGSLVCIYISLCRPRPNYVLPKLTLIVVQLALYIIAAVAIIIYFSGAAYATNKAIVDIFEHYSGEKVRDDELDGLNRNMKYTAAIALGAIVLATIYNIWFLLVMRTYYRYVKDKAAAEKATAFQPVPTAPPPPPPPYNTVYEKA